MLDALEDGELNFRFKDKSTYNRTLNRLRGIFERQRVKNEQESWTKLIRLLTHEIMNSLAPIISISETLSSSMEGGNNDPEYIREGLGIITDSSVKMKSFIENYRQLSGLTKPLKRETSLQEIIEKVIILHRELLHDAKCECKVNIKDRELKIYSDELQISQVFINLLRNALQAGARHIEFHAINIEESGVKIIIGNDGQPIHPETQEMIFVPFFTTKSDGTGIGLSVCRQIIQAHKGSIDLIRSNPKETVFEIFLPNKV